MPTDSCALHHSPAAKNARRLSSQFCIYTAVAVGSFGFAQDDGTGSGRGIRSVLSVHHSRSAMPLEQFPKCSDRTLHWTQTPPRFVILSVVEGSIRHWRCECLLSPLPFITPRLPRTPAGCRVSFVFMPLSLSDPSASLRMTIRGAGRERKGGPFILGNARRLSGQFCIYTAVAVRSFGFAQNDDTRGWMRHEERSFSAPSREAV